MEQQASSNIRTILSSYSSPKDARGVKWIYRCAKLKLHAITIHVHIQCLPVGLTHGLDLKKYNTQIKMRGTFSVFFYRIFNYCDHEHFLEIVFFPQQIILFDTIFRARTFLHTYYVVQLAYLLALAQQYINTFMASVGSHFLVHCFIAPLEIAPGIIIPTSNGCPTCCCVREDAIYGISSQHLGLIVSLGSPWLDSCCTLTYFI